jgi:hypothetical protein
MRRSTLAACLAACLVFGGGAAFAAFSSTTSNSGNSFQAAASFNGTLRMATGSYSGDGVDNRAISTGFQPDFVIVKADTLQVGAARTSSMTGDNAKPLIGATGLTANLIQSLTATGFTLGTSAAVNASGTTYRWIAFKAGTGALKVNSYTGNGTSQSIAGAGFSPEYAIVMSADVDWAIQRFSGMSTTFRFDGTGVASAISSLDPDGFSVGSAAEANVSGRTYH